MSFPKRSIPITELGLDMYFGDRIVQTLSMLDEGLPVRLGPAGIEKVCEVIDESLNESPPFLMPRALKAVQELSSKTGEAGHHLKYRELVQQGVRADVQGDGNRRLILCGVALERAGDGETVPGDIPTHTRCPWGCAITAPFMSATIRRRTSPERRVWA